MSVESSHPRDELQALLDGRLSDEARQAVEDHLEACLRCRREIEALARLKEQVAVMPEATVPPGLERRALEALDAEDARAERPRRLPPWLPVAAAAGLVGLALLTPLWDVGRADAAADARAALAAVTARELVLGARDLQPSGLEEWFTEQDLGFPARVFDFGGMSLELVGGRVHRLAGEPAALFVYRRPDGSFVVCQMYEGSMPSAGAEGDVHYRDDGVEFRTFRRGGAVLVFWQEGSVACVLGSESLNPAEVRALAFAKAVKV